MIYFFIALIVILLVLFILASKTLGMAGTSKRCEGNANLKYLKAKNFDNLNARPIDFKSNKGQTLNGFLYSNAKVDTYKALVVFSHGMGAGHHAYTTEINYFAQKGYLVWAYDNTGSCLSEGKKLYEQIANANHKKMTRLELIHASMSGQLQNYDFNYDEAYANVIKDFAKPVEVDNPIELKGELRPYQKTGLKWLWTNITKGFVF